jgi:hypothetical protein
METTTTLARPRTFSAATPNIRHCHRCGVAYDWRRSASSSLKMTYCGSLCEAGDLGFTIDGLIQALSHRQA